MECLRGFIGFTGCGSTSAPESGKDITSLPGISLESIVAATKPEQQTYLNAYDDIQTRALNRFDSAIRTEFGERYRIRTVRKSMDIGKDVLATEVDLSDNPYLVGYEILTNPDYLENYGRAFSTLQSEFIQSVPFYFNDDIPEGNPPVVKLHIIDLDTKEELFYSETPVTEIGWQSLVVAERFSARKLFVGVEPDFKIYSMPITTKLTGGYVTTLSSFYGCDCHGLIRGVKIMDEAINTIEYTRDLYGVSGIFSLMCSYDNIVCNNKHAFGTALWYLLGYEAINDRLYSKRWNKWTLDKEEAKSLQKYYYGEFLNEIKIAVGGIDLDTDDACLECGAQISIQSARP